MKANILMHVWGKIKDGPQSYELFHHLFYLYTIVLAHHLAFYIGVPVEVYVCNALLGIKCVLQAKINVY